MWVADLMGIQTTVCSCGEAILCRFDKGLLRCSFRQCICVLFYCRINKKGSETRDKNFSKLVEQSLRFYSPKCVLAGYEMCHRYKKRNTEADSCSKPCTVDAHIAGKHKKAVAEYIKNTAGKYTRGSKARIICKKAG